MANQRRIKRATVSVVVLLLLAIPSGLAGCGTSSQPTAAPTNAPSSTTAPPPADTSAPVDTQTRSSDEMVIVYVPAGQFEMGSTDAQLDQAMQTCYEQLGEWNQCQRDAYLDEQPPHAVQLDAYWIGQTEVSNAQFACFLNEMGNQSVDGIQWLEPGSGHRGVEYGLIEQVDGLFRPQTGYEDFPVVEVSWPGADAYCTWADGRLPTEAEWEYAARGPEGRLYPWGNEWDDRLLNHDGTDYRDGQARWMPVGSFPDGASRCGALDMAGNVWEWVADWWSADSYARSPSRNPQGPESGTVRIGRGGSWYDPARHVRSASRKGLSPSSYRVHWVGFRCVVPVDKPS